MDPITIYVVLVVFLATLIRSVFGFGGALVAVPLLALLVPVTHYYLLSLPFTIPAILIGRVLNHRLRDDDFLRYLHFGLVLTGLALLVQAVRF